jgi:hypothetical protein
MQGHIWWINTKRLGMSLPLVATLMVIALAVSAIGTFGKPWSSHSLLLAFIIGLIFVFVQTRLEYNRRKHDYTLALKYQDVFEGKEFRGKRACAAKEIIRCLDNPKEELSDEVEYILDFLEDLGFYCKGDQISPEVVHHHFEHWIRGYLQATHVYVAEARKDEPTLWDHLIYLQEVTDAVESSKRKKCPEELRLSPSALREFLEDEKQESEI